MRIPQRGNENENELQGGLKCAWSVLEGCFGGGPGGENQWPGAP